MTGRGLNWPILLGFLLSLFAMMSYPLIFAAWPATRDFPWVNVALFGISAGLVYAGVRRGFGSNKGWFSKIGASSLAVLSALVLFMFLLTVFITPTWLPEAAGAPKVGQRAPGFTLSDSRGSHVSLSELLLSPINTGAPSRAVVLIFYRGYW